MAFHHKIKPHHHASVWAIAALTLTVGSLNYSNAVLTYAASSSGPSQKTKEFFGAGDDDDYGRPQICIDEENARMASSSQSASGGGEREALQTEITELQSSIAALETQIYSLGEGSQEAVELLAQLDTKRSQRDAKQAQIDSLGGAEDGQSQQSSEPSEACYRAVGAQIRTEKTAFKAVIKNNIVPTFSRVAQVTAKITAKLPSLEAAGVDGAVIEQVKGYLVDIETDAAVLVVFMNAEAGRIDALSKDDLTLGKQMEAGQSMPEGGESAATAADDLVTKFEKLSTLIESL